jgi:ComF family protein
LLLLRGFMDAMTFRIHLWSCAMLQSLSSFGEFFLELLFPERCAGCGRYGELFCPRCRSHLQAYPAALEALPDLDAAFVAFLFDERIRNALHQFKYRRVQRMARPLADLMAQQLRPALPSGALLPVPLHAGRLAERGFNQAEVLARRLAERTRRPLCIDGLQRCRETGQQARLNRSERRRNMEDAFVWEAAAAPPPMVLIVDDVLTTGATIAACARALREAGSREVYAVALARSLPGG